MRLTLMATAVLAALAFACAPAHAADNYTVKDSTGATKTICAEDASSVYATCHVSVKADGSTKVDPATEQKQDSQQTTLDAISAKLLLPVGGTATTTITRPADTTAYAVGDAIADSTSSPTSGGFTLSSVCSASGKTTIITGLRVVADGGAPSVLLAGVLELFDTSVTAVNDNAAYTLSDSDAAKRVARIPVTLASNVGAGTVTSTGYEVDGLGITATCVGSANLRFLFRTTSAWTPASGETVTFRATYVQVN